MLDSLLDSHDDRIFSIRTRASNSATPLPLTPDMLINEPSGNLFGLTQNAGMGWSSDKMSGRQVLILSTHGGLRAPDGTPTALGYHTGHWEVNLLVSCAAEELKTLGAIPFAAYCTDPCDGRSQGTSGMYDSLPYRNDAAIVFRRLVRSLPTRAAVIGIATCDKGLPAMMMALAGSGHLPVILIPGGVTLMPETGEDAGRVQSIGTRYAHGYLTLEDAAEAGCRACATPGGGCQFLGTAATSQVVAEALGLTLPHAALAPSGEEVWYDIAKRSAHAALHLAAHGMNGASILSSHSIENAMICHAAFGGSTNLLIHLPAIAHAAGLRRPSVDDWLRVNRAVPRLVDALPNGPGNFSTVQVFLAGGVPEVMLHLRQAGLLHTGELTAAGITLDESLNWWQNSERRVRFQRCLQELDGIDPQRVIMSPVRAQTFGMTSTVSFPHGNLAPGGSIVKSTSIDPSVISQDNVYRLRGPAHVFTTERSAILAIKSGEIVAGDVLILICRGPLGSGMEETYQITSALKYLPIGKHVAVITDARFSGVSTGACIGHVSPEALAGGPIGKILDGDLIEIVIDRVNLKGEVNLVGEGDHIFGSEEGTRRLQQRSPRPDLKPDGDLPVDTRLWAALQNVSGGVWGGCVYDAESINSILSANSTRS